MDLTFLTVALTNFKDVFVSLNCDYNALGEPITSQLTNNKNVVNYGGVSNLTTLCLQPHAKRNGPSAQCEKYWHG